VSAANSPQLFGATWSLKDIHKVSVGVEVDSLAEKLVDPVVFGDSATQWLRRRGWQVGRGADARLLFQVQWIQDPSRSRRRQEDAPGALSVRLGVWRYASVVGRPTHLYVVPTWAVERVRWVRPGETMQSALSDEMQRQLAAFTLARGYR